MKNLRNILLEKGFFPETLPPCFDSTDLPRAFKGLMTTLRERQLNNRRDCDYIRYNGTKHDGNRRPYGTPNPIPYFSVCTFIHDNWKTFQHKFDQSKLSLSQPRVSTDEEDRAIIVSSLSELSSRMSENIKYAPYILKTDISQFFPSIYTHSIPWVAHGKSTAKKYRSPKSELAIFNKLDKHIQQCQNGQTRGVIIGPDAFRVVAEFLSSEIDSKLYDTASEYILGAVRHVDDFYIGVRSEIDATIVLSHLRNILQGFDLHINDTKTKITPGLETSDDLWAQKLRALEISNMFNSNDASKINLAIDTAIEVSKQINSESPVKLILRRLDRSKFYTDYEWEDIESKLQRIMYHYPHCMDYICLMVAKRYKTMGTIDKQGWSEAAQLIIKRQKAFNHHHEIVWLFWLNIVCELEFHPDTIDELSNIQNSHITSLLVCAYTNELISKKPKITFNSKLDTDDEHWLLNLVARSEGFTKASFSGELSDEFEHLASKEIKLLDFEKHMKLLAKKGTTAISKSKYGYDSEDDEYDEDDYINLHDSDIDF